MLSLALWSALTLGGALPGENPAGAEAPRYTFPAGPVARAWAGVGPDTLAEPPPALPRPGVHQWTAWRRDLEEARAAASPDPRRRARLARMARAHGRDADAWNHLAACLARPEVLAGLAPLFLPGTQDSGPLPDGALLLPALPPRSEADPWGRSTMAVAGLAIGAGRVDMQVSIDPDGVQVEFAHAGGAEALRLKVGLPEPDEHVIRIAYVDWFRQDDVHGPYELELAPGDEPHVVFGRFAPRMAPWTSELPIERPASLARDGLRLELAALAAPVRSHLEGLDEALAKLLQARVEVFQVDPAAAPVPFAGLRIRLEPETWSRELNAILSAVERYVLRPPDSAEDAPDGPR